eukprot:jgi/Botrbrau1/16644/Bobra.0068s0061.1
MFCGSVLSAANISTSGSQPCTSGRGQVQCCLDLNSQLLQRTKIKCTPHIKRCKRASLHNPNPGSLICRATLVAPPTEVPEVQLPNGALQGTWKWNGHSIRYQRSGESGPPLVLVHGFGGNADHWRKNLPALAAHCRVFAIDLLGYGYSDKPCPRVAPPNSIYTFETWAEQLLSFVDAFVGEPVFLICNSVGGIAGLEAAVRDHNRVRGVQLLNISLRMLHEKKQSPLMRPLVRGLQQTLRDTPLGEWFFSSVAQPQTVRSILQQCYGDPETVTDDLVEVILKPGLQPGAARVFLDFISYSGGPLPEELLQSVSCPVSILWGEADPWEKLEWGRALQGPTVEEFIPLPGLGHCPHDEAPHRVNPLILKFVERHTGLQLAAPN